MRRGVALLLMAAAIVTLLATAGSLSAQSVSGTVRSVNDARAIAGAVLLLLHQPSDSVVARSTTAANGRFMLRAPAAGRYALRVLRLGQVPVSLSAFELAPGEAKQLNLDLTRELIRLATFNVRADGVCRSSPDASSLAGQLLAEARTAWQSSLSTRAEAAMAADYLLFTRAQNLAGRLVEPEAVSVRSRATDRPFASLPPRVLAAQGYVRADEDSVTYRGPDETTLLSREFAEQHCFSVVQGTGARRDAQGIAFRPVRTRDSVVDIRGTIWMRAGEAVLNDVEFEYDPATREERRVGTGGRVAFAQLESGEWIVGAWEVRMPRRVIRRTRGQLGRMQSTRDEMVIEGLQVAGGVVTRMGVIAADSLRALYVDSAALARQQAYATAEATARNRAVATAASDGNPDAATTRPAACASSGDTLPAGAITGRLSDEAGRALRNVTVRVQWSDDFRMAVGDRVRFTRRNVQAQTDPNGEYVLCAVPIDRPLSVSAFVDDLDRGTRSARLSYTRPVQTLDLLVARSVAERERATFRVRVRDAVGPVADADVTLEGPFGVLRARSDTLGIATFDQIRPMVAQLQVRKVGLSVVQLPVDVPAGEHALDVPMEAATLIDEVRVTATAVSARLAVVEERRRAGVANAFLSREDLDRTSSGALSLSLRRVAGIRIADSLGTVVAVSARGERVSREGQLEACVLQVMVDGVISRSLSLDAIPTSQIYAVEVFLGAARIPPQLGRALGETPCGLIAVWTRAG